jgi:DNA-binding transcriptional LysR family regulator
MASVSMEWESRLGRRLRIRDIYILATVVKCGGMAKAARQLAMSQPSVSEAIAHLEHVLRVRLLDRGPQGIVSTIYADALLKRGAVVFDELRQGVRDIEHLADPAAGEVRVGCAESFMAGLLPAIIEKLSRRYPKIVVHAEYAQHATTEFHELRERNFDLVIARISEPFAQDEFGFEPLYEEEYLVVAGSKSVWARRRKIELAELLDEPWILMPPNIVISSLVEEAFRQNGLEVPRGRVASLSMHLRTHLLATGNFLTVMPNTMFRFNAEQWSLKALPIDLGIRSRQVGVITLKHRTLSPVVELFIEHARTAATSIQCSTRPTKRAAVC